MALKKQTLRWHNEAVTEETMIIDFRDAEWGQHGLCFGVGVPAVSAPRQWGMGGNMKIGDGSQLSF